jgi:hypothetical protein
MSCNNICIHSKHMLSYAFYTEVSDNLLVNSHILMCVDPLPQVGGRGEIVVICQKVIKIQLLRKKIQMAIQKCVAV